MLEKAFPDTENFRLAHDFSFDLIGRLKSKASAMCATPADAAQLGHSTPLRTQRLLRCIHAPHQSRLRSFLPEFELHVSSLLKQGQGDLVPVRFWRKWRTLAVSSVWQCGHSSSATPIEAPIQSCMVAIDEVTTSPPEGFYIRSWTYARRYSWMFIVTASVKPVRLTTLDFQYAWRLAVIHQQLVRGAVVCLGVGKQPVQGILFEVRVFSAIRQCRCVRPVKMTKYLDEHAASEVSPQNSDAGHGVGC